MRSRSLPTYAVAATATAVSLTLFGQDIPFRADVLAIGDATVEYALTNTSTKTAVIDNRHVLTARPASPHDDGKLSRKVWPVASPLAKPGAKHSTVGSTLDTYWRDTPAKSVRHGIILEPREVFTLRRRHVRRDE